MFPNIRAEMARKNMTIVTLSELTGIRYQTLSDKLRGHGIITLDDAVRIKNALDTDIALETLFCND